MHESIQKVVTKTIPDNNLSINSFLPHSFNSLKTRKSPVLKKNHLFITRIFNNALSHKVIIKITE